MRGTLQFSLVKNALIDDAKVYRCKICKVIVPEANTQEHARHHKANSFVLEV